MKTQVNGWNNNTMGVWVAIITDFQKIKKQKQKKTDIMLETELVDPHVNSKDTTEINPPSSSYL